MGQGTEELSSDIEGTRRDLSRDLDALTNKVSPSQVIERRKAATRNRLGSMKDKVMGSAHSATSSVSAGGSNVGDTAQSAMGTVQQRTEGNPLAAGLIAFGAGWLVSSLIPASDKETRLAGQAVERAKQHGGPVMDEARSTGQQMAQDLKEQATQAADEVKSSAQESVQTVKDEGQSSATNVKDDAQQRM
jgi:gas vesicle protein